MLEGVTGQPGRIVVAGDWHGNRPWAVAKIRSGSPLLAGETDRIFLHFGDFGFYPGHLGYLHAVSDELRRHNARLLAIDGNHENHPWLATFPEAWKAFGRTEPPWQITSRIWWLPRGYRWMWHDRTWVAIGGGVSLNRVKLIEGFDWFAGEELSDEQADAIIAAGPADVIVSHDCPSGIAHTYPPPDPSWDLRDLARAAVHGERLQRVGEGLKATKWMHGHLHQAYVRTTDIGWGPVTVTGLDCDFNPGWEPTRNQHKINTAVLDIRDMTWTPYE